MLSPSLLWLPLSLVPASEEGAPAVLAGVMGDTELALQRGHGMKSSPLTPSSASLERMQSSDHAVAGEQEPEGALQSEGE